MSDLDPAWSIEGTEFIRRFLKPGERPSSKHFLAALAAERAAGYADAVAKLRDGEAFARWLASREPQMYYCSNARDAEIAAEYLESLTNKETS